MATRRANPPYLQFEARTRAEWRDWLQTNHAHTLGVWLVTYKKGSGEAHLSYNEAVEEALAFGWIDSLARKLDDKRSMLLMTQRKKGSSWSKLNKQRIERLMDDGQMTKAGLAKITAAKQDGSWDRLNEVDALTIPPDLAVAFRADPLAQAHFKAFPPSTQRGILEWLLNAKRPETRAKRIMETVSLAHLNQRANQYKRQE